MVRPASTELECSIIDARLMIDLDGDPIARFEPEERYPVP